MGPVRRSQDFYEQSPTGGAAAFRAPSVAFERFLGFGANTLQPGYFTPKIPRRV